MEYTIGTAVFNDWIIVREIGQGATGHVYEIKKNGCGEEIRSALKVIKIPKSLSDVKAVMSEGMTEADVTDYFKEFVDEILREIKIMVSLKEHPNIVTYEDHCVISHEDGIGWDILIKMELLTPLQDWQMDHPMNEKEMLMKQLRANAFPHNNGKVMQAINIIRHSYNRLTDVQQAAQIWGVSQDDFLDCINYLAMAKYIQLRTIADKILVPDFADIGWDLLEAKLTAEGISVLCHKTKDEMIEV